MNPAFMYVVWIVIAVAVVASAVFLIRVMVQLRPLIVRLNSSAQFLETSRPKIDRILDGLEVELAEIRGISEKANRIVGSAERVTTGLRDAVQPFITEASNIARSARHVRAAAMAVRAGLTAWWGHRSRDGEEPPVEIEHYEEM